MFGFRIRKSRQPVVGSISGSNSLIIPAGAWPLVTITARGGAGGDNSWYNPGQPYIAATQYWQNIMYYTAYGPGPAPSINPYSLPLWTIADGSTIPGSPGPTRWEVVGSAGQPYIAPTSGGGPYYGPNTTSTFAGVTRTWQGGYGSGVLGTVSVQTLSLGGAGGTITNNIGSGGSMSYIYYI